MCDSGYEIEANFFFDIEPKLFNLNIILETKIMPVSIKLIKYKRLKILQYGKYLLGHAGNFINQ